MALNLAFDCVGAAVERLEDVRKVGGRNAWTVIADRDAHFGAPALTNVLGAHADPSVAPAVLDGIGHEILHRGAERRGVADDDGQIRLDLTMHGDFCRSNKR